MSSGTQFTSGSFRAKSPPLTKEAYCNLADCFKMLSPHPQTLSYFPCSEQRHGQKAPLN